MDLIGSFAPPAEERESEVVGPGATGLYDSEGNVTDGSVDYYDFDWGDEVEYAEWTMRSGCERARASFDECSSCAESGGEEPAEPEGPDDGGDPDPAEECDSGLPIQDDLDAYEIVDL